MNGKHLVSAILCVFCVIATLLATLPIMGSPVGRESEKIEDLSVATKEADIAACHSPKLEYETIYLGRFNITSGNFHYFNIPDWNNPVFCGGYSRISVFYGIWDMSEGNYNVTILVSGVTWFVEKQGGPYLLERTHILDTAIHRHDEGFDSITPEPALIETKGPYFALEFGTCTDAASWQDIWIVIDVYVYLRSE